MQTTDTPAKKPGRPAKLEQAMPDKMRAAAYRARRREAASLAHENLKDAAPAVLLAALVRQIKGLADPGRAPVARELAGMVIAELCDRYKIPLPRTPGAIHPGQKGGAGPW
jgi:hypothetical protein